jgi:hypothetical protein
LLRAGQPLNNTTRFSFPLLSVWGKEVYFIELVAANITRAMSVRPFVRRNSKRCVTFGIYMYISRVVQLLHTHPDFLPVGVIVKISLSTA